MSRRRSNIDAIYEVLKACNTETKISYVLRRANLSHQQLKKYLSVLIEYGLVEASASSFKTTKKGKLFMKRFEELIDILDERRMNESPRGLRSQKTGREVS